MKAKHKNKVCSSQKARKSMRSRWKSRAFNTLQQIIDERIITRKTPGPSSTLAQLHQIQWRWASNGCFLHLRSFFSSSRSSCLSLMDGCPKDAEWRQPVLAELGFHWVKAEGLERAKGFLQELPKNRDKRKTK